jgi:predicted Fe-Mo cluster-binding NifX family protein
MIVAIPIKKDSVKSTISLKFARSSYFAIVNKEAKSVRIIKNPFENDNSDVGKRIVNWLRVDHMADAFVAYELGLKVQQLAKEKKIQLIVMNNDSIKLEKMLKYMNVD